MVARVTEKSNEGDWEDARRKKIWRKGEEEKGRWQIRDKTEKFGK